MNKLTIPLKRFANEIGFNPVNITLQERAELTSYQVKQLLKASFPYEEQAPVTFTYIDNWWDAFKERWFPAWAKKRWPVKYAMKKWTIETVYPNLNTQFPTEILGDRVSIVINNQPIGLFITDPMGMTPRDWNAKITTQSFDAAWRDGSRICHCCGRAIKYL